VLVVDDNDINLRVAVALLHRLGYDVQALKSGLEAVEAVRTGAFDAVLMDCHMPGLDGFEATRRIRSLPPEHARVPIVALTASALPEELERCHAAGMDGCIAKPVSLAALGQTLERLLSGAPKR
jgi:hypothetical protein